LERLAFGLATVVDSSRPTRHNEKVAIIACGHRPIPRGASSLTLVSPSIYGNSRGQLV